MANPTGRKIIIVCSCGWGLERASIRAANSAFFVHQLTTPGTAEHVSFVQEMTPGTRSPISEYFEGGLAQ